MYAASSAAEAVGSWPERVQLYKTAGVRESADFGTKANYFDALEPYGDLGFRQRRWSRSGWSSESSDRATAGAVRQEDENLDLECLQCGQKDEKTLKDRKELGPGYEETETRRSRSASGSESRDQ